MKLSKSIACAASSLMLVSALPAAAAGDNTSSHSKSAATAEQTNVQGTVEAVTHKDMTVKDSEGHSVKVEVNKSTQFSNSGKTGSLSDLREGMSVSVEGKKQKDGTLRATSVRYDKSAAADKKAG